MTSKRRSRSQSLKGKPVWDRKARRWRVGGRWAKPPTLNELRIDRKGRILGWDGKLIPAKAPLRSPVESLVKLVGEIRKPKPKQVRKPETIQELPRTPFVKGMINSSNWNKKRPENVKQIFENILIRATKHSAFEIQDILIFQHGFKFTGQDRLSLEMKQSLASLASEYGISIKYSDTGLGTEVHAFLGREMKLYDDVSGKLQQLQKFSQKLYDQLIDYWGQLDWWYWFETEESFYE